jgi:putative membrane protein
VAQPAPPVTVAAPPASGSTTIYIPQTVTVAPPTTAVPAVVTPSVADVDFMSNALQEGMAEVRLAQLAQPRAGSEAVRRLTQRLVADHSQANSELLALAQQRGLTLPQTYQPHAGAIEQRLSRHSGMPFDVAFLEHMIGDHARAVAMLERAAATAGDPALRAWAARYLPVVREHQASTQNLHAQLTGTSVVPSASPLLLPR